MITEISKHLVGKTILGYPTGNNQNRALTRDDKPQNLVEFEVISVGRKYMELKRNNSKHSDKYNTNGATQKCVNSGYGGNAGYHFFENMEDFAEWERLGAKRRDVERYFRNYQHPTAEQILKIHAILFESEGE